MQKLSKASEKNLLKFFSLFKKLHLFYFSLIVFFYYNIFSTLNSLLDTFQPEHIIYIFIIFTFSFVFIIGMLIFNLKNMED